MTTKNMRFFIASFILVSISAGCAKKPLLALSSSSEKTLYVASGVCYSGNGNTTFTATTAANLVYKVDLATGTPGEIIADYNVASAISGSSPVGIIPRTDGGLWIVVENPTAGARRIESFTDGATSPAYYYSNASAFSSQIRRSVFDSTTNSFLISKGAAIEKINSTPNRDLAGVNPWVNNPAGNCSGTNTMITAVATLPNGKILYGHASTTATNRKLALVSSTGYRVATDCLSTSAVTVPSYITDIVFIPEYNQVLVSMASNTTGDNMNSIYVFDVDPTTNTITNGTSLLENNSTSGDKYAPYLYGATSMAFDSETSTLYVAVANAIATTVQNYNIEKLNYDPVEKKLTRMTRTPWSVGWVGSKCISALLVK